MNIKMKELIVMVLGLVEIIAGFALYEESQLGGVTFIFLGFAFLAIMFIMERKDYQSKNYNLK